MKVNIIISPSQQVENKCAVGDSEANHCRLIAQKVADRLSRYNCNVRLIPELTGGQTERLEKVVNASNYFVKTNPADFSYHLDIHTDAGYMASGASAFFMSEGGKAFVQMVHKEVSAITPWADGNVSRRDLFVLKNTTAIAGLIELSFHDKAHEAKWIHDNMDLIADAIVKGIVKGTFIELKKFELTLDAAMDLLVNKGIINNKDYWKLTCKSIRYQEDLFINMAKYILKT